MILCFPGGYIAPHAGVLAIAIAGLMGIAERIIMIAVTGGYLGVGRFAN